jgi:small-conductance mechanosensitive channel
VSLDQFAGLLSTSTVAAGVLVLAAGALAHVALRWWIHGRARRQEREAVAAPATRVPVCLWLARGFRAGLAPLALIIWIHGLFLVSRLVAAEITPAAWSEQVSSVLGWSYGLALTGALVWLLSRIGAIVEALLVTVSLRSETAWDDVMLPLVGKGVRLALPLVAVMFGAAALDLTPEGERHFRNAGTVAVIALAAWLLFQAVDALAAMVLRRHRLDVGDNLQARAIHTQVMVLKKVAQAVVVVFTLASMLMVFESVRQFGTSILASAGIAGIVVGLAAQRSLATLLAGFQIALTQPIRVDDVVIVEKEWGRIEDITLTYVVVRVWDLRRLVLPITYFIEQPFQNWTRSSADIFGTVFLHVDYGAPVDALRAELTRLLEASPLWDGKVNVLQVTEAKEHTLEVRALASASDASKAWDLRCEIREKLVAFLRERHPGALPRLRGSIEMQTVDAS